jgi:atrial natriuretic peptide receptor A
MPKECPSSKEVSIVRAPLNVLARLVFQSDAFLGPVCDYVLAPVARYAGVWGIPVLTAGAQADAFRHKPLSYPTLTRMMGSYRLVGEALRHILHVFGWQVAGLLYHNHGVGSPRGNSMCHFTLGAVFTALNQTPAHRSFNEDTATPQEYRELLQFVSRSARSKCRVPT